MKGGEGDKDHQHHGSKNGKKNTGATESTNEGATSLTSHGGDASKLPGSAVPSSQLDGTFIFNPDSRELPTAGAGDDAGPAPLPKGPSAGSI